MKLGMVVVCIAAAFLAGLAIGWNFGATRELKAEAQDADARTSAITASVDRQLAVRQAELTREQSRSLALQQELGEIHLAGVNLQLEISNARFTSPASAGTCPDPVGSDEFLRLYNAAAAGGRAARGPAGAGAR